MKPKVILSALTGVLLSAQVMSVANSAIYSNGTATATFNAFLYTEVTSRIRGWPE